MLSAFAVLGLMLAAGSLRAQDLTPLAALQQQDLRLARLAERMLVANSSLCRERMPVTGVIIHSRDQYAAAAEAHFANGHVEVALVVPGSPAERAGLRPGDGIAAINGTRLETLPRTKAPVRDSVFDLLAGQPPGEPLEIVALREGSASLVLVQPQPGCRALVEVLSDEKRIARSDGRVIQLSFGLMSGMSDDALAASFAHELAHVVLEHRRRLSEAGVRKGFFGEFGSNRRHNRQAEVEADRMSLHLLANAGLDPAIAPRFWRSSEGRRVDAGIFRSTIYPSPAARAELMEEELARFLPLGTGPSAAGHLIALRDQSF